MPLSVLVTIGFLSGWCFSLIFHLDDEDRASRARHRLVMFTAGLGCVALVLALGEAFRIEWAYKIEDILIGQRATPVLLAMLAGVVVYLFRDHLGETLRHLRDIVLDDRSGRNGTSDGQSGKDGQPGKEGETNQRDFRKANFPWYVGVGVLVSIVIVSLLAFNPQFLRHLTILKAGGLEADFSSGTAAVQRGQLSVIDPNRKSTLVNWESFSFPRDGDVRLATYTANLGLDHDRLGRAREFFDTNLEPLLNQLACLDGAQVSPPLNVETDLRRLAADLAERIKFDLKPPKTSKDGVAETTTRAQQKAEPETSQPTFESVAKELGKLSASCAGRPDTEKKMAEYAMSPKPDPWDPYVIQAVGDLLMLTAERPLRENFLAAVASDPRMDHSCKDRCISPTAGQLSLAYALVEAQVQSSRPWPVGDMIDKLSDTLRRIDIVLAMTEAANNTAASALFRHNRLVDLSLGLQLFYQRAISGYALTPLQRQIWRDWLQEVRGVLALDLAVGSAWPPPFDAKLRSSWRTGRELIAKDLALVQDAAIGSALSLVLLPLPEEAPSSADCLAARALLHVAKGGQDAMFDQIHFDADDKSTYKGLMEQIDSRIDSECGS